MPVNAARNSTASIVNVHCTPTVATRTPAMTYPTIGERPTRRATRPRRSAAERPIVTVATQGITPKDALRSALGVAAAQSGIEGQQSAVRHRGHDPEREFVEPVGLEVVLLQIDLQVAKLGIGCGPGDIIKPDRATPPKPSTVA